MQNFNFETLKLENLDFDTAQLTRYSPGTCSLTLALANGCFFKADRTQTKTGITLSCSFFRVNTRELDSPAFFEPLIPNLFDEKTRAFENRAFDFLEKQANP